jgi:hypothetical protein
MDSYLSVQLCCPQLSPKHTVDAIACAPFPPLQLLFLTRSYIQSSAPSAHRSTRCLTLKRPPPSPSPQEKSRITGPTFRRERGLRGVGAEYGRECVPKTPAVRAYSHVCRIIISIKNDLPNLHACLPGPPQHGSLLPLASQVHRQCLYVTPSPLLSYTLIITL